MEFSKEKRSATRVLGTDAPLLMTATTAAKILSLSTPSIRRLVDSGVLTPIRLGGAVRFRVADLVSLADGGAPKVANPEAEPDAPVDRT